MTDFYATMDRSEVRQWTIAAVAAEAASRRDGWDSENPQPATWDGVYEWFTSGGTRGWLELVTWWRDAANVLENAIQTRDLPEFDAILTVEDYVTFIYAYFEREHELPYDRALRVLAYAALQE